MLNSSIFSTYLLFKLNELDTNGPSCLYWEYKRNKTPDKVAKELYCIAFGYSHTG